MKYLQRKFKQLNPYTKMLIAATLAFVILFITLYLIGYGKGKAAQKAVDDAILAETIRQADDKYDAMVARYEEKLAEEDVKILSEAEYVAKLLYGQARWNSKDAQRAIVWLVINRVENSQFPNTIQEVVQQPSQWMGYSDDNIIEQALYDIAIDVITDWHNGNYRPISPDYLYLAWTQTGVTLRTTYKETNATQYLNYK